MATIRNKFHELGNWHNKISMAVMVTKENFADENLWQLPSQELKERIEKAIKDLNKIEQFIVGADEAVGAMKPFIYEKIGGDAEILTQREYGRD